MIVPRILSGIRELLQPYLSGEINTMGSDHEPKHNMKRMEDHCRMPVYIMDVMLSLLAHADISDIAAEVTLFGQTLFDFLETLHCVDSIIHGRTDLVFSLDVSIRRLQYLSKKIPTLNSATVIRYLEPHLISTYIQIRKMDCSDMSHLHDVLNISPHWRALLQREGLVVAVDDE